jgi:hypothetical protein
MTNDTPRPAPMIIRRPAPAPVPQEGCEEFLRRARALSGLDEVDFRRIQGTDRALVLAPGDNLPGVIVARRGPVYLCTVGSPDGEREDGSPFWDPRPENWAFCIITDRNGPSFFRSYRGDLTATRRNQFDIYRGAQALLAAAGGCWPAMQAVVEGGPGL